MILPKDALPVEYCVVFSSSWLLPVWRAREHKGGSRLKPQSSFQIVSAHLQQRHCRASQHTRALDTAERHSTRGRYGANSCLLLTARDVPPFSRPHPHSPATRTLSNHLQRILGAATGRGEVCYRGWHGEARCNALHPTTQDRIHTHSLTPSAIRAAAEEPKLKFL